MSVTDLNADVDQTDITATLDTGTPAELSEALGWGDQSASDPVDTALDAVTDPAVRRILQTAIADLRTEVGKKNRLGFHWAEDALIRDHGREKALAALDNGFPYLTRRADLDVLGAEPNMERPHILIEGDNINALVALSGTHKGKVDLIYIDPPYNTGKEFTYNDVFIDSEHSYKHSSWLAFMNRRLQVARGLLKDSGVIMIAIDDNEYAHLKILCDQIFGEGNFIAPVIWQGGRKNDSRFLSNGHEYMLIYAKNKGVLIDADVKWRESKSGVDEIAAAGLRCLSEAAGDSVEATRGLKAWFRSLDEDHPAKAHKHYCNVDASGRVFFAGPVSWPGGGGPTYDVIHPATGRPCKRPSPGWRYSQETMQKLVAAGDILFGKDETTVPTRKTYIEATDEQVAETVFHKDRRASNKELAAILGASAFDFPKDPAVLARWFKIVAPKDALVLDFFAGSGTTGHAVAALNAEDGGTRQCIMVTLDENGICQEVTRKRMEAVLTGKWADGKPHDALPGSLVFYEAKEVADIPDLGFASQEVLLEVAAKNSAESVFVDSAAWTPIRTTDTRLVAAAGEEHVVAVWTEMCDDLGLLEALDGIAGERDRRYLYLTNDTASLTGDAADWAERGWTLIPYPDQYAYAVDGARKRAISG